MLDTIQNFKTIYIHGWGSDEHSSQVVSSFPKMLLDCDQTRSGTPGSEFFRFQRKTFSSSMVSLMKDNVPSLTSRRWNSDIELNIQWQINIRLSQELLPWYSI